MQNQDFENQSRAEVLLATNLFQMKPTTLLGALEAILLLCDQLFQFSLPQIAKEWLQLLPKV